MIFKTKSRWTMVSLAVLLGLLFTTSTLTSLALAQAPDKEKKDIGIQAVEGESYWLILDSARPVDEVLPPLLDILARLKANGTLIDFDPTPQANAPTAVPGVRVVATPEQIDRLRALPGVLAVSATLPPPPPSGLGVLATTGSITGRVTDAGSGTPLNSAGVAVFDAISFAWLDETWADTNGIYTITVTAPYSQAKIEFYAPGYAQQWYNNKAFFSEADKVNVNGVVTNINAAMVKSGFISGTVTHEGGGSVEDVGVAAYDSLSGAWLNSGQTDSNGQFLFSVPGGSYKIEFYGNVVWEWYQDKPSRNQANPVDVTSGMTTSITAQVTRTGSISGVVTAEATGLPLDNVEVDVYDATGDEIEDDVTDFDGSYIVSGLDPGQYKIRFKHNLLSYIPEYYDNAPNLSTAGWVTVNPGVTPDINAALAAATSQISGTITKNGGTPLAAGESVDVDIYDAVTGEYLNDTPYLRFTGDGVQTTYVFTVAPGTYKVHFYAYSGLENEWYNNKTSKSTADVVAITAGAVTPNINADLVVTGPGCVTGTVTSGGQPLEGAAVLIFEVGVEIYNGQSTDTAGQYRLCVEPGDYQISFSYFPSATTWYNGQVSRSTATSVTVTDGVTQTMINGNIGTELGGCISGKAAYLDGTAARPAVAIFDAGGQFVLASFGKYGMYLDSWGDTDNDGGFVACGLPAGNYTVFLDDYYGEGSAAATVTLGQSVDVGVVEIGLRQYFPIIMKH